jgi:hypothetical protein
MKKLSVLPIVAMLTLPALAVESESLTTGESVYKDTVVQKSNPKAAFPHGLQFGVGASATSGFNAFVGYNNKKLDSFWAKRFGIRFDFASTSPIKEDLNKNINEEIDEKGVEVYDDLHIDNFSLSANHYGAMVDFYPFGDTWFLGGWRVSGGYFMGKLDLDADIHGTKAGENIKFELNKRTYYYADSDVMPAKASADWKYNGPYLGTGFDLGLIWGFKIFFDAGVVFTSNTATFDLDVPSAGLLDENLDPIIEGTAKYDQYVVDKNATLADARKEIDKYPYYPLVKMGFMFRF